MQSRKKWSNEKLFERLLKNKSNKGYWDNIVELRKRSTTDVFEKCRELVHSNIPKDRIIGFDVLAQLGVSSRPFCRESVKLFFEILEYETDYKVISSILFAIGQNNEDLNQKQIDQLILFKTYKDSSIRYALVSSLLGLENNQAIQTLIELSHDKVSSVRDWATFGIGSMIETNQEEIRKALWNRINDKNQNVKLEAIVGLAHRKDENVRNIIERELINGEYGTLLFEAIEELNCIEFLPLLKNNLISVQNDSDINPEWLKDLELLIYKLENPLKQNSF
jgi:HEAT repeat protein